MRILADENVSSAVVASLRAAGADVLSVKESMRSCSDEVILKRAKDDHRVLVTHDKDFGEMAFRHSMPAPLGVVLFRLSGRNPESDNRRMLSVLLAHHDWASRFSVVTDARIRSRALPRPETGD